MQTPEPDELSIAADDLLVFVDDTGHESFAGNQAFYGLGGCVILGSHYNYVKAQWAAVREKINGDPSSPLHASEMQRRESNFAALSEFFLKPAFARVAVVATINVVLPNGMHPAAAVMGALQEEIADIASLLPCSKVSIIVESSQRADPIVRQRYGQVEPTGVTLSIPFGHYFMPKSSGEPGLEIADFVVSAASSQAQRHLRGKSGYSPDFNDVFCRLPAIGSRFSLVTAVDGDGELTLMNRLRLVDSKPPWPQDRRDLHRENGV